MSSYQHQALIEQGLQKLELIRRYTFLLTFAVIAGGLFYIATAVSRSQREQESTNRTATETVKRKGALKPYPALKASEHTNDGKHHLLLAATGSVATIKIPSIIQALSAYKNLSIRLLFTESAKEFLQAQSEEQPSLHTISKLPNVDGIYFDADEWSQPWTRNAPILHIELRRWADLMLIAPLSANSLAKLALGLSSDLISSVARAWDTTGLIDSSRSVAEGRRKKIMVAPAMNTAMWNHPVTARHVRVLEEEWKDFVEVLRPVEKDLACGDVGGGAMREWKDIVTIVEQRLQLQQEQ